MKSQSAGAPKRMMTVHYEGVRPVFRINSSSVDLLQTCLRKSHYVLNRKLMSEGGTPALSFGTAIHKALEHWYTLPTEERELDKVQTAEAEMMAHGHRMDEPRSGALESIRRFVTSQFRTLSELPDRDKRSLPNGIKILRTYFRNYAEDGLEVMRDDKGPIIERDVEFTLIDEPALKVIYFGTIDVVLRQTLGGIVLVTDHKTTSSLGGEFYSRCKPNHQYTGYVMAAREALGLDARLFLVNGIQVATTRHEFARQITERTEEDFDQFRESVREVCVRWLRAQALESFPMSAPNPCSMYGGCQFHKVCEVPLSMRESVIRSAWREDGDIPPMFL